jgi:hypothetical protein
MTIKTKICPVSESRWREKAMKVRLTAFIIISTHIRTMSALRRTRTPAAPMTNRIAPNNRNHEVGTAATAE